MKSHTVTRLVTAIVFILLSGTLMALNRPTPAAGEALVIVLPDLSSFAFVIIST